MPFNMGLLAVGGRTIVLATLTVEDLALDYNVESEVASQFPALAPTIAGDIIQLTLGGVDLIGANSSGYAIDADGLHDDAIFQIVMQTGCLLSARGGDGGRGGNGFWSMADISQPGFVGRDAGPAAIRFGCETNISGTGTISKGYGGGGGGGGGAAHSTIAHGGGGGGGGAPLGAGGDGGFGGSDNGVAGTAGTVANNGTGGAAGGAAGGAGGDGGDSGSAQQAGSTGTKSGGAAGNDGDAIDSQGFTHSEGGSITVTGAII